MLTDKGVVELDIAVETSSPKNKTQFLFRLVISNTHNFIPKTKKDLGQLHDTNFFCPIYPVTLL